jgi:hypothetical protein
MLPLNDKVLMQDSAKGSGNVQRNTDVIMTVSEINIFVPDLASEASNVTEVYEGNKWANAPTLLR